MIRNRKDGSEYTIPNIVDKWERNGGSELKHYKSDQLLAIVSACAAMLKTMRLAELDLTFDFNAERMDFLARMAEFKMTAELGLDVLDERLDTERTKLADVDNMGRLAESVRNGKYVPPVIHPEWTNKVRIKTMDDGWLNETLETINVLIGEISIALSNMPSDWTPSELAKYRDPVSDAKREFNAAQHLFEEERARRRRLLTKPHAADLFPHDWANDQKVRIPMLSNELITEKKREFLAQAEAVGAQIENAPGWWNSEVFDCAQDVLDTIQRNAKFCDAELNKRREAAKSSVTDAHGEALRGKEMMEKIMANPGSVVMPYMPETYQEKFFRALVEGRVDIHPLPSMVMGYTDPTPSYRVTIAAETAQPGDATK